jgi:hypothetical protein
MLVALNATGGATGFLPENIVDILEGLFEHAAPESL